MPSLNRQILIAACLGVLIGWGLGFLPAEQGVRSGVLYASTLIGSIFIGMLKMILVPLIFTSIVVGVANLQAHHQVNRVWITTLVYFVITASLAMLVALIAANIFKPGADLPITLFADAMDAFEARQLTMPEFFLHFFANLFQNPFAAFANGSILAIVVFALFIGIALVAGGERYSGILTLMQEFLELLMQVINWIMRLAPLGILALLIRLVAEQDVSLLVTMLGFIVLVFATTLLHGVVILPGILFAVTGKSPLWFWRGSREALITAFATSSSAATLPISLRCAEHNLGVRRSIAGFVLPLGATMNMDGTALYEAAAALFVANLVGIELSFAQQMVVFFTAMIASTGAPGIPSAGMVTMVMVLQAVGLPAEAIAILLPIDRLLDTVRTAVNVEGDIVGSLVVDKLVHRGEES
ncbi:dicarboxylate/amino acid:cation symporter [Halopseudomonas pelagia]|uniref:Dicarboxylate/amino acid:cation symporter n=1 Tax=Halopseudomonas pelagia TaxID=553151 RepID=A0AA91U589_9GAMM|nr:dicarboxylate/amino acid:cation symporter [Halopseudomonas pelagia]PCD00913.1 dicarboxylate/amino acid:cation symporter [Halopseudomonas pelagia]QFY58201.1 dicarboxylate/amino acid:cation symporter [Halopseudomonas pelagia]